MKELKIIFGLALAVALAAGCKKESDDEQLDNTLTASQKVNRFILDCAETYYLWEDKVNWTTYENGYRNYEPENLFDEITYTDDKWSTLTDDINSLSDEFSGVSTSFGWVPIRVAFSDGKTYFYIVLFVYPGTPADRAGIKRGDYIVYINNQPITSDNYMSVYTATSISVNMGTLENNTLYVHEGAISLTASNMYQDPILKDTVFVKGDKRIAYLCYTDFLEQSESSLVNLFKQFKSQNVTDVILDLRYNGGGYVRTSVLLTSMLAPQNIVSGGKGVYQYQIWNSALTSYFRSQGDDMTEYFTDTLLHANLAPQSVYFLTSEFTASASEAAVVALQPYMTVRTVGETTAGKFVGGGLFSPQDIYDENYANYYRSIQDWGMYLMCFRYTNSAKTYFLGGIEPDYKVMTDVDNQTAEDYFNLQPFGSESDPLLNEALYRLTGVRPAVTRAATLSRPKGMTVIPDLSPAKPLDGKFIASPVCR